MLINDGKSKTEGIVPPEVQIKPVAEVSTEVGTKVAGSGSTSAAPTTLEQLLMVIMAREARLAKKEEEEESRRSAKKEQYLRNATDDTGAIQEKQKNCKHLKGGKNRKATQNEDYLLSIHTFIDGVTRIKCLLCGMKWFPLDTDEFLVRGGKLVPNHTGLGWKEVFRFVGKSTNTPTTSEIPLKTPTGVEMATTLAAQATANRTS